MKIYITTGTYDFLRSILQKYEHEMMILMENEENALLLHETEKKSVFKSPQSYEVIDSSGQLDKKSGFFVLNHIPVTDEGRPILEYRFKNRTGDLEKAPGYKAFRLLRPLKSDTYIVLTCWKDEQSFQNWKHSKAFEKAHSNQGNEKAAEGKKKIFPRPSYVKTYLIPKEES